jgi:excisionase family DNA binding protein
MIERHYSTGDLAEILSVHPETLRRAAQSGDIRYVRIGRDLRFPESAVQEWLGARTGQVVQFDAHHRTRRTA